LIGRSWANASSIRASFDAVPLRIGRFGFRGCYFTVERRVDIATLVRGRNRRADREAVPDLRENISAPTDSIGLWLSWKGLS
jgi:hypothetical protein